jgi:hypothetical protein
MRRAFLLLLLVGLLAGCGGAGGGGGRPAGQGDIDKIKMAMTTTFSALEMYAHDHSLTYPDEMKVLVPKYLDALALDPRNGQPLSYQKTERGYLISASADYSSAGAAKGFPQMDQDGFFALKASDFPSEETLGEEP